MNKLKSYSLLLNALGTGPKTSKELIAITKKKGILARIAEFNRSFNDIEIGKTDTFPKKYYLVFPNNIKLKNTFVYPNAKRRVYTLRTKNGVDFNG